MILPVMGIISEVIPVFAQAHLRVHGDRPLDGRDRLLLRSSCGRTSSPVGLSNVLLGFFMVSSMIIAIPTGVKIFNWIATIWRGNIRFDTPMLFALGFVGLRRSAGWSGIFVAAVPIDFQAHDSYYVVAHLHYVLFGGSIFGIFAGLYYWWPKMFGRLLDERLGKWCSGCCSSGSTSRSSRSTCSGSGHAAPDLHVRAAGPGDIQPDLDDRLVRDGGRDLGSS